MSNETRPTPKAKDTQIETQPAAQGQAVAASAASAQTEADVPKKAAPKTKAAKATAPVPAQAKVAARNAPAVTKTVAKPVKPAAPVEATTPADPGKASKTKKHAPVKPKLVRDSFTLPETDYALFGTLKQRALARGTEVKKSELVRAGLALLAGSDDARFIEALSLVERIKTGRPKK